MRKTGKGKMEGAGWRTGDAADFLDLTPEEAAFIELKLALANHLRAFRRDHAWTQTYVARRVGSSQSRVAKMEGADASVSVDLLVRALLALGVTRKDVAKAIASRAG